jgi:MFS family permease
LGVIADRYDRRKVILAVAGLATLINGFIVVLNGMASGWFLLLIYMSTGLVFTLYGLGAAHANDAISPEQTVSASAGLLLAFGIGASVGPLGAATLMENMDRNGLFGFFALITLTLVVFAIYRMARGMPIAAEDKNAFVPVPVTTTPSLANLDPRSEPAQGDLDLPE